MDSSQGSPCSPAHLSSIDVVEHKVEFLGRLEGVAQAHEEGVPHVLQKHVALRHDVVLLWGHRQGSCHSPPLAGGAPLPFLRRPCGSSLPGPAPCLVFRGLRGQSHPQSVHMGAAPAPRSGVMNKEYMISASTRPHSRLCSRCFPCLGTLFSDHRTPPSRPAARPPPSGRLPLPTLMMSLLMLIPSPGCSDFISSPLWGWSYQ